MQSNNLCTWSEGILEVIKVIMVFACTMFLDSYGEFKSQRKKKRGKCKENLLKTLVNFCKHERRE